jgi:hypothetical protein
MGWVGKALRISERFVITPTFYNKLEYPGIPVENIWSRRPLRLANYVEQFYLISKQFTKLQSKVISRMRWAILRTIKFNNPEDKTAV